MFTITANIFFIHKAKVRLQLCVSVIFTFLPSSVSAPQNRILDSCVDFETTARMLCHSEWGGFLCLFNSSLIWKCLHIWQFYFRLKQNGIRLWSFTIRALYLYYELLIIIWKVYDWNGCDIHKQLTKSGCVCLCIFIYPRHGRKYLTSDFLSCHPILTIWLLSLDLLCHLECISVTEWLQLYPKLQWMSADS